MEPSDAIEPSLPLNHRTSTLPSKTFKKGLLTMLWGGLLVLVTISAISFHKEPLLSANEMMEIEVIGDDRRWTARSPGPDGTLHSGDDLLTPGHITLIQNRPVTLHLKSKDQLYVFAVPHEKLSQIAVPGMDFSLSFTPTQAGDFPLLGSPMCGGSNQRHGILHVTPQP